MKMLIMISDNRHHLFEMDISSIIMCSGYRGVGKDTFCQDLMLGNMRKWRSNSSTAKADNNFFKQLRAMIIFENTTVIRGAFGDILKSEIQKDLGFTITNENEDEILTENGETGRDLCVRYAREKREQEASYFARRLFDQYSSSKAGFDGNCLFITDWKFPEELEYATRKFPNLRIVTLRLEKQLVPIPPEPEEHELDTYPFHFRLISD